LGRVGSGVLIASLSSQRMSSWFAFMS
jgi:hypothetical protein